jgi:two-component system, chemotaxis family, response regulator Rcp1
VHQRGRPARILLVEDSVADAKLFGLALEESGSTSEVMRAEDGDDALRKLTAILNGDLPRPDVVVLDINLPRANGFDVLRRIKGDPDLRTLPVVIFSTSRAEVDVAAAYACGASSYVVKPVDLHRFMDVVRSIEAYWTATVRLP